jgi:hypothetical protein
MSPQEQKSHNVASHLNQKSNIKMQKYNAKLKNKKNKETTNHTNSTNIFLAFKGRGRYNFAF